MGGSSSKGQLKRRNTLARRSQRKSMHSIKGRTANILKSIKTCGEGDDAGLQGCRAQLDHLLRELELKELDLQPELRGLCSAIHSLIDECYQLLDKETTNDLSIEETSSTEKREEEEGAVRQGVEEKQVAKRNVQLTIVEIEPNPPTFDLDKRKSIIKMGVPVLPNAVAGEASRKSVDFRTLTPEKEVAFVREQVEDLEMEISKFFGRKNGKHYSRIKQKLDGLGEKLRGIAANCADSDGQVQLCLSYVGSCASFLDEKAYECNGSDDEVFVSSPKPVKTTLI